MKLSHVHDVNNFKLDYLCVFLGGSELPSSSKTSDSFQVQQPSLIPETSMAFPTPESLPPPPQKKLRSSYNALEDLEQLQTINMLVTAQEILYPEMRKYFNKEYTDVIHREFMVSGCSTEEF